MHDISALVQQHSSFPPLDTPVRRFYCYAMQVRSLAKPFTIAGFILGEIFMLFVVLAPYRTGAEIPLWSLIGKIFASSLFFGPFGAAAGLGLGFIVAALLPKR